MHPATQFAPTSSAPATPKHTHSSTQKRRSCSPSSRPLLSQQIPPTEPKRPATQPAPIEEQKAGFDMPVLPPVAQEDCEELPRTGLFFPLERTATVLLPVPVDTREEMGKPLGAAELLEVQKRETEKFALPGRGQRVVYDAYEVSPYQKDYGYDELGFYNTECFPIDGSTAAYSQVCGGKGAPSKFYPGKARYPRLLRPFYVPQTQTDATLVFESRFESGNLRRAVQMYLLHAN